MNYTVVRLRLRNLNLGPTHYQALDASNVLQQCSVSSVHRSVFLDIALAIKDRSLSFPRSTIRTSLTLIAKSSRSVNHCSGQRFRWWSVFRSYLSPTPKVGVSTICQTRYLLTLYCNPYNSTHIRIILRICVLLYGLRRRNELE